ncbi:MAG: heavy-metal-associated domain-containing protein [Steroidobacteraceae bacterium]
MQSVVLKIQGMHCGGCAQSIKRLLEREPGVESAEVSFEAGEARVRFDPSRIGAERLVSVLQPPGYQASIQPAA